MAWQCRLKEKLVRRELKDLAAKILPSARGLKAELMEASPSPVYGRIIGVIRNHIKVAEQTGATGNAPFTAEDD
jgi:hypothetical protein